jgi:hypothetical protein
MAQSKKASPKLAASKTAKSTKRAAATNVTRKVALRKYQKA